MSQKIQRPGVGAALQSFFRLTGSVAPTLEEFILPVVVVADIAKQENFVPPLRRHCAVMVNQAAVTDEGFQARLEVPPGIIADITRVAFVSTAPFKINAAFDASFVTPPVTVVEGVFTDSRIGGVAGGVIPSSKLLVGTDTGTVVGSRWSLHFDPLVEAQAAYHPQGWLIGFGDPDNFGFLEFASDVDNLAIRINLEWDEYLIV